MRRRRIDFQDISGKTFGRWSVLAYAHAKNRISYYHCRCSCGELRIVNAAALRNGKSQSCGCLHREIVSSRQTHGHARHDRQHRLYTVWAQMLSRCYSPTANGYNNYGGRGIQVCERWRHSFETFIADMGRRPSKHHTIDRYPDNDGNYEPGNCRWATAKEQARNKRSNHVLEFNDKALCVTEWAAVLGTTPGVLFTRLALGWDTEKILTVPVHSKMTKEIADEIRTKLHKRNGVKIAAEYGVSNGTISMIRNGKIWV